MRHPFRSQRVHPRVHPKDRPAHFDPANVTPELERRWFELDRNEVLGQIDLTEAAVAGEAKDLEMVAYEGMFRKLLSRRLLTESRVLNGVARQLRALRRAVGRARSYPKIHKTRP
jgi:hypothetical protein